MKQGGNKLINSIYEANLTAGEKETLRPTNQTPMEARAAFIFDKYQHRKYYDSSSLVKGSSSPTKREKKAVYKPPPAFGQSDDKDVDDFLGSRHNQREGSGFLEDFVKDRDTEWWKMNAKQRGELLNNASESTMEIQFDPLKSGQRRFSDNGPKSPRFGRGDSELAQRRQSKGLLQTLQRMESKSRLLDDIKHMNIDPDNPLPSPKRASRSSKRRERERQAKKISSLDTAEKSKSSEERKRGVNRSRSFDSPNAEDRRKTVREGGEQKPETSSGRQSTKDRRRPVPGRSRSYNDDSEEPKRTGSRAAAEERRQRALGRSSSWGDDDVEKPVSMRSGRAGDSKPSSSRRTARRGSEVGSSTTEGGWRDVDVQKPSRPAGGSEHTENSASRRNRREPKRGVGRTRSMDSDSDFGVSKPRSSRLTRPPRSSLSGELKQARGHESASDFRGFNASGSEFSTMSAGSSSRGSGAGRRSRTDDDAPASSSRSGRSRASEDSGARRGARPRSVGAKIARSSRKPSSGGTKSRSPQRDEFAGRSRGGVQAQRNTGSSSRTPSPPGNDARDRRRRQLPPASPARKSPATSNMEELGRLLSGS